MHLFISRCVYLRLHSIPTGDLTGGTESIFSKHANRARERFSLDLYIFKLRLLKKTW